MEVHDAYRVAYVRRGSFGCRTQGRAYELVAGSVMIGRPGVEYLCTHEHHALGDVCLSVQLSGDLVDVLCRQGKAWRSGCLPPLSQLMVVGELAQAAAAGRSNIGVDEAALLFACKLVETAAERQAPLRSRTSARDRRRAVEAALWLDAHSRESIDLEKAARHALLSPFHFLRLFSDVLGVTPHQYLVRLRLRHAARLLVEEERRITDVALEAGFADLSNFMRTFRRAAGVSPSRFRLSTKGERRIFEERIARRA